MRDQRNELKIFCEGYFFFIYSNYYNNKLEFEIKGGKGIIKEINCYNGDLEYEGEYINGKRNGKGKEYYDNGKLRFEGEYLNGKKYGKGKEYYNIISKGVIASPLPKIGGVIIM